MNTEVKIVRAYWGESDKLREEIPPVPIYTNQIVFVWGSTNESFLRSRGFDTFLMSDDIPESYLSYNGQFYRKLLALDMALSMFDEVILLDWDCYILREFDDDFYKSLREKPIQCPLYGQYEKVSESWSEALTPENADKEGWYSICDETFPKYTWKLGTTLVSPNFCFIYSSDKSLGKSLIDIANKYELLGCIEEHAMYIYADCSLDDYIKRYQPIFLYGVSDDDSGRDFLVNRSQKLVNEYLENSIKMTHYLKHI
jgi:hypothetical protein